jgi:hypothetical protein
MIDRKVYTSGTPALVVILFHRQAHRPMVDNRNHLPQVFGEDAEEQYLVAVVESGQIDILTNRIQQQLVLGVDGRCLSL